MRLVILLLLFPLIVSFSQVREGVSQRYVAFTFDDLPSTHDLNAKYIIEHLTEKLVKHKVPATGFVNEIKLYSDDKPNQAQISLLEHWLDRGFDLGNHSYSHISIDKATLAEYKADVLRGEKITKELLNKRGKKLTYYRHTQLRTGPTPEIKKELEEFLKDHGYTVAPVTIDNNEYIFADIYKRARLKDDTSMMKTIGVAYLRYMESIVKHFEKLSLDFLGYEVKQTLLLHANTLNADYMDELIQLFQNRNYEFVSLDAALKDPAYQLADVSVKKGLSWLHRWMLAKGLEIQEEPSEPEEISKLFKSYK
jgi:peptidoglycan/xylan/chitin deacetylase (PgdA/CDA1 family)